VKSVRKDRGRSFAIESSVLWYPTCSWRNSGTLAIHTYLWTLCWTNSLSIGSLVWELNFYC